LRGRVYEQAKPRRLIRLFGQPPIGGAVYELQRLRCNLCGQIQIAPAPEGVGDDKYDASAIGMVAMLKYGTGVPFNRLERVQRNVEIPLPASTQWDIAKSGASRVEPVVDELVRQAAQGEVLHNDDTTMTVLALGKPCTDAEGHDEGAAEDGRERKRTGVFTSGIVATAEGRKIALFFTGWRHAGENLSEVLRKRAAGLSPPIQMCDALSRNLPAKLEVILSNCLSHARRKFVEAAPRFPTECIRVLEALRDVYAVDAEAKALGLSPADRLRLHQKKSGPVMKDLDAWRQEQLDTKRVEPNSGLGQALKYLKRHWIPLTLFLREAGAPLDNNICERALKKAILHRKNSLFYKTERGSRVGDIFMTLIHTAELAGIGAFDYLTELLRHPTEVKARPDQWLPWTYRQARDPPPGTVAAMAGATG
jgi:hypothetical protein